VRRLDLAGELRFNDPADGLRVLRTFAGLQLPGLRQTRRSSARRIESVSWGVAVKHRLYDAGAHHGTDIPGIRVRLERQKRYPKPDQVSPGSITAADMGGLFLHGIAEVIRAAPVMTVLPPCDAERSIIESVQAKRLSLAVAERLLGVVRIIDLGEDGSLYDVPTASGRQRDLRRRGITLDWSGRAFADSRGL